MKNDDLLSKYEVESFSDEEPQENELLKKYAIEEPKQETNSLLEAFSKILQQAKSAPGEAWEGLKQSGPEAIDIGKTLLGQSPATSVEDIVAGLAKGLRGTGNIPAKGVGKGNYFDPTEWEKSVLGTQEPGRQKLQNLASFASNQIGAKNPYAMMGRAGLWAVGQEENPFTAMLGALPTHLIPKTVERIKELTQSRRSPINEITTPPDGGGGGPTDIGGGLVDKALNLIGKESLDEFAQNIVEKQKKKSPASKWMEKNINPMPYTTLTKAELDENMALARGRKIPIGDIFEDPALSKKFSNELAMVEDSPAKEIMMNTARDITDEGSQILKHLSFEGTPAQKAHIGNAIISEVKNLKNEIATNKSAKYKEFDSEAKKSGAKTNLSNVKSYASNALNEIQSNPFNESDVPPEIIKALKNVVEKAPEEINLSDANFKKSTYGDILYDPKSTNFEKKIFGNLLDNIKMDIQNSLDQHGSPKLKELYNDAEKYYKEEYLPFEDPDIKKYITGKGDPDLLMQHFIRTGRLTDRSKLLRKITDKIEPTSRNLFGHSFLSNAVNEKGRFNPSAALTLWKNLGEGQREAMFGNYTPIINEYMKKVAMSSDALNMMHNPKTGVAALPLLKQLQTMGAQASAGGLLGLGVSHDPLVSTLIGMASPYASKKIAAQHHKFLVNRHTSEAYRNKVYRKKIAEMNSKNSNLPPHLRLLNQSLLEADLANRSEYEGMRKSKEIK